MKKFAIFFVLVLAGAIAWRFAGGKGSGGQLSIAAVREIQGTPVDVAVPRRLALVETIPFEGDVEALHDVPCMSDAEGRVVELAADVGTTVVKGQVVARIDSAKQEADVKRAEAALQAARATLDKLEAGARKEEREQARARVVEAEAALKLASQEKARIEGLAARKAAPSQQVDTVRAQHRMAVARLRQAREALALIEAGAREEDLRLARAQVGVASASLERARVDLAQTRVVAPVSGIVAERNVELGEIIRNMPSPKELFRVVDIDRVHVVAELSEFDAVHVSVGQEAEVFADALALEGAGRPESRAVEAGGFDGRVSEKAPAGDPRRRAFRIKVEVSNGQHRLKPGMFARGKIVLRRHGEGPVLDPKWLVARTNGRGEVLVVRQGRAERVSLVLGAQTEEGVGVASGISDTDEVVVRGHRSLRGGERVRVVGRTDSGSVTRER